MATKYIDKINLPGNVEIDLRDSISEMKDVNFTRLASGQIPMFDGRSWVNQNLSSNLPIVASADNGKIMQVVNGAWALVTPVSIYTGNSAPNNSQGIDGDIYIQQ